MRGSSGSALHQRRRLVGAASLVVLVLACGGLASDGPGGELESNEGGLPGERGGAGGLLDPGGRVTGDADPDPTRPTRPGSGVGGMGSGGGGARSGGVAGTRSDGAIDGEGPRLVTPDSEDCPSAPLSLAETVAALTNAVAAEAPADRRFIRYLSTGPLRTTCSSPETRPIARAHAAVDKIVNSLSLEAVPVPTRPVGADALLLRVDLRDYGWERSVSVGGVTYLDAWEAIVAQSAMAHEFVGGDLDSLKLQVGTPIPWLLASHFVAVASRAPLYYALTAAPSTLAELKAKLGITTAEDLPGGPWQRAGFSTSGISQQDRGVARYAGQALGAGMFWQTFDYAPATSASGPYLAPLAAQADAVEAIYGLPNGLPAYFIADADGRRVDEAPFLVDPAQRGGKSRVMASCGSCHNSGIIVFDDTVRSFVEANIAGTFTPAQVEAVRAAYPSPSDMRARTDEDSQRLQRALVQAGQPESSPDPISRIALDYEYDVDLTVVASELYVSPDMLDTARLPPALSAALTVNGLAREALEANYHDALCVLHTGRLVPVGCP